MNIKSTVTDVNEAVALAECERGEDVAKRAYEVALQKDLPPDAKSIVERQYQGVKQSHDRVRDLPAGAVPAEPDHGMVNDAPPWTWSPVAPQRQSDTAVRVRKAGIVFPRQGLPQDGFASVGARPPNTAQVSTGLK